MSEIQRCATPGHVHVRPDTIAAENGCTIIPRTVVPIPPDPARDARVAARRAADAARAAIALDKLLLPIADPLESAYHLGWSDGYAASDLHHNRHYARREMGCPNDCGHTDCPVHGDARPAETCRCAGVGFGGKGECRVHGDARPDGAV